MSIRRRSTTHDLATLRLHPDGSRVQQSSVNARRRTAGSTVIDSRGNWIAKDAGGKSSVKRRRSVSNSHTRGADGEFINLSDDEEHSRGWSNKEKQRVRDSQIPDEHSTQELKPERSNTRARQRLSFMRDLSFLDPPPVSVSSLEQDAGHSDAGSARELAVSFPDPAPDLLKAIHHFTCCYYRERGQLLDSSKDFRGKRKYGYKQSQENIHTFVGNALKYQNTDSETDDTETGDEITGEDADESEATGNEGDEKGRSSTKVHAYRKDMYKAFDGSALMAIGIVLQEYVGHTLSPRPRTLEGSRRPK